MDKETIELVSRYMQGDTLPLSGRALRLRVEKESHELSAIVQYAEAAVGYVKRTMPMDHHISGFDGKEISIQCSCPEHPAQTVQVRSNAAWLPKKKKDDKWAIWPSLFSVAPATKIRECIHCAEEKSNPAIIMRAVCRYHKDTLLKADFKCPECLGGAKLSAIDGRSITVVSRGGVTTTYKCPMHGDYSVGHRANDHGCQTCNSYEGIVGYAATLERRNVKEIKRVKAIADRMLAKHLRKTAYHPSLGAQKIAMIRDLVKRCFDPNNNMHLLPVFPTVAFVYGEWLVAHEQPATLPKSMHEYLMPFPTILVDAAESNKAAMMDDAYVACDTAWRTAHWSRHKEFV